MPQPWANSGVDLHLDLDPADGRRTGLERALHLGWLVLPPHWIDPVVDTKLHTDHHTETLGQLALADLITTHAYDRHIRACRLRYRRRRDLLRQRLHHHTPHGIPTGLHLLLHVPDENAVLTRAAHHGLRLGALREHWHAPGPTSRQGIVIGYATPAEHAYRAAIDALHHALGNPTP